MRRALLALLVLLAAPAWSAQVARPISDSATEQCIRSSGSDSWDLLDDDAYAGTVNCGGASCTADDCASCWAGRQTILKITSLTDPVSSTGHILTVGCADGSNGQRWVQLRQGTDTEITDTANLTCSLGEQEKTYTLSAAQANAITDYTDLYIEIEGGSQCDDGECAGACANYTDGIQRIVGYVKFEVPDAPAGTRRRAMVVP